MLSILMMATMKTIIMKEKITILASHRLPTTDLQSENDIVVQITIAPWRIIRIMETESKFLAFEAPILVVKMWCSRTNHRLMNICASCIKFYHSCVHLRDV